MPLKGLLLAWLTVLAAAVAWIVAGVLLVSSHPVVAECMNWALTIAIGFYYEALD